MPGFESAEREDHYECEVGIGHETGRPRRLIILRGLPGSGKLHGAADDSLLTATDPALIAEEPEQRAGV
jgi:hypothetical protein